ncbi:MAG TPA: hypothetical protein VKQ32_09630 [Polyangia bacterium]|nr:hypothetical protein [Polyangia bacterium]
MNETATKGRGGGAVPPTLAESLNRLTLFELAALRSEAGLGGWLIRPATCRICGGPLGAGQSGICSAACSDAAFRPVAGRRWRRRKAGGAA